MISTQKQPGCKKKGVALFKMASAKKSCKIKGGSQEITVMWQILQGIIATIWVNFVLIPIEAGMKQHKLP